MLNLTRESHLHFVTGKLAETVVREVAESLSSRYGFRYSVEVMPITVAALMTPDWLARKLVLPENVTHLIVPGFCENGIERLRGHFAAEIVLGPKDCRDMGELFGESPEAIALDDHDIDIIAEINHAPRWDRDEFVRYAELLVAQGADVIDVGCDPAARFDDVGAYVGALTDRGISVSIDTFDPWEVEQAVAAGASLVLSVNSSNRQHAVDWGVEVVAIPDTPTDIDSLGETAEFLDKHGVPARLDAILEPIGAGLAASLSRYGWVRERYPEAAMMMGIGNLTELTDVDSAGINLLLMGVCQELRIGSVLTTQVINWARSSVRECDHARRLTFQSVRRGVPPKNMSSQLVMLRDGKLKPGYSRQAFEELAESIKDNNYRLFAQDGEFHLVSRDLHLRSADPFELFDHLLRQPISDNVDQGHAFYLGYELAKASIALTLGKNYQQDQALDWGMLTQAEDLHRIERTSRHRRKRAKGDNDA